jgi:serine/threonine protein kinase
MSESWIQWEGHVIDGRFELKQCLSSSEQSAVFLTEICPHEASIGQAAEGQAPEAIKLAIKLIAADPAHAALQLSRWRLAQILSHSNLLRVFDTGSCRLAGEDLIFGVMEFADENLAQIIPERPLTIDETRQMLEPTLGALAYLHGQGLVHGCLTPANVMAVGDQIKLASDSISPVTEAVVDFVAAGVYDAPETASGTKSAASDVWSLGMVLSEALTQRLPVQNGSKSGTTDPGLPENFPAPFVEIVRGCLRRDPSLRWTVTGIASWLHPEAPLEAAPTVDDFEPATAVDGEPQANVPAEHLASKTEAVEPPTAPIAVEACVPPESLAPREHSEVFNPDFLNHRVDEISAGASASAAASTSSPVAFSTAASSPVVSSPLVNQGVSTHSLQQPPVLAAPPVLLDFLSWTVPLIRRFTLPAIFAMAALAALYASFGLFHHESATASSADVPSAKTAQQQASQVGPPQKPRSSSSRSDAKPSPRVRAGSVDHSNRSAPSILPAPVTAGSSDNHDLGVAQQVMPAASRSALSTIWGTVRVDVKIKIDSAGNATGVQFATRGPSAYFARLSQQAAQEWKFDPRQAGRSFLLHFEFRNSGIKAYATRAGA